MCDGYTHRIIRRLRGQGLKVTPQRIAILRYLEGNRAHPSVEDIHRDVVREYPTISLATVYNTLDTLEQIREIQAITIDPSRKHYDPDTSAHHHALCNQCRAIQDVFAPEDGSWQVPEGATNGFRIDSASVYFRGVCHRCRTT